MSEHMSQIQVKCVDQVLKIVKAPVIASGGLNEVCVVFDFCEKWDGFMKTALFYRDAETVYYAVLDDNDMCVVPWEVYHEAGYFYFSVFGEKGNARRTSNKVRYKTVGGAITEELIPPDPTPDVYDQIIALVAETKEGQVAFIEEGTKATKAAETATAEAVAATEAANTAAATAKTATEQANSAKTAAEKAAEDANAAAAEAEDATEAAQQATAAAETVTRETIAARDAFLETASESIQTITDLLGTADEGPAIVCEESGRIITLNDSSNRLLKGLTLCGKTTQNGTPAPENPVEMVTAGASGSIGVAVCGKNLYGFDELTVSGYKNIALPFTLPAGTYTFSGYVTSTDTDETTSAIGAIAVGETIPAKYAGFYRNAYNARTLTIDKPCDRIRLLCATSIGASSGDTSTWTRLQIESGSVATEYEPYKPVQTLTASTPNGLPGIPVTSGGNYTDESGQQWVCDEKDYANGEYVQRVGRIDGYAGEEIPGAFMSSTGELTTGATVLYALADPIKTPLSANELSAFAALHTNKPNTTVHNDGGAGMKLEYTADTKIYIDNKFNELAAALVNNT